jgi:hypothetical protein
VSAPDGGALVLQLYDLRREARLREARQWFGTFAPVTCDEVVSAWRGAETSASYRMVTSYWDMACALVNHGAIDAAMFHATTTEHGFVFARLEPYLTELRSISGIVDYLVELERCALGMPGTRLAWHRQRAETARAARRG